MRSISGALRSWWYVPACLAFAACAPKSLVEVAPPSGVVDPAIVATADGATQLYNYAINNFAKVYGGNASVCNSNYLITVGIVTDELMTAGSGGSTDDARTWDIGTSPFSCSASSFRVYTQPRVEARQAREALALYAPATPRAWQGRLYALEGYAIVMLAELYCSGVPLSTVSFLGVTTPTAGFTTDDMFQRAVALFDSALTVSADSDRFTSFARIGKGRALLGLGKIADAAAAVQSVPTGFVYNAEFGVSPNDNRLGTNPRVVFAQDREGTNGLIWSTDPRTAIVTTPTLSSGMPYSAKYSRTSTGGLDATQAIANTPVPVATGMEARLIEAEADVAAGGSNWLSLLNTLRATCIGTAACAPVPGITASQLPPLTDPGTASARLDLVMQERAMWLYLTGHRQGDMRRLAHLYHRDPQSVWPTGLYVNPGFAPLIVASGLNGTLYGTAVVFAPESNNSEKLLNPLYLGCVNYDP